MDMIGLNLTEHEDGPMTTRSVTYYVAESRCTCGAYFVQTANTLGRAKTLAQALLAAHRAG
jgi:hypothetical protein